MIEIDQGVGRLDRSELFRPMAQPTRDVEGQRTSPRRPMREVHATLVGEEARGVVVDASMYGGAERSDGKNEITDVTKLAAL